MLPLPFSLDGAPAGRVSAARHATGSGCRACSMRATRSRGSTTTSGSERPGQRPPRALSAVRHRGDREPWTSLLRNGVAPRLVRPAVARRTVGYERQRAPPPPGPGHGADLRGSARRRYPQLNVAGSTPPCMGEETARSWFDSLARLGRHGWLLDGARADAPIPCPAARRGRTARPVGARLHGLPDRRCAFTSCSKA